MRRKQRTTLFVSILVIVAAIGVIVAAVYVPLNVDTSASQTRITSSKDSSARFGHTTRPKLEAFGGIARRSLQGPLFDPPPVEEPEPEPEPELPPKPPPEVQLLATMLEEPGTSHALFSQPDGSVLVRSVGQTIGEEGAAVRISQITERQVKLSFEGNEFTLELPPEPIE
ncbi:hypothetical protein ACFL2H_14130 [Planctomycetota bacterium]